MPGKTLTQEEQMYWRFVASERLYKALQHAYGAIHWGAYYRESPENAAQLQKECEEALALAEGRIE